MGKRVLMTVYLDPEQVEGLKRIHARTKAPVSALIREGVDLRLAQETSPPKARSTSA